MRHTFRSLVVGYKRLGSFSFKEYIQLMVTSFVAGFIFSFRKWGDASGNWDLGIGIYHVFIYTLFSFLALFIMQFSIRFMAVMMGYKPSYSYWKLGLATNLFITFLTNGAAIFILPGGFDIQKVDAMQIGKFKRGILMRERGYLVFWGFFGLVVYTLLIKAIMPFAFAKEMIIVAYVIALWSLFPIDLLARIYMKDCPISNGSSLFFTNPNVFGVFAVSFLLLSGFFTIFLSAIWPLILSIIVSFIIYVIFYTFYDPSRKMWGNDG